MAGQGVGGLYLYGIINTADAGALGISGVDGVSPVQVVTRDGLGCVVSDYRGEEFSSMTKEELVRRLLAHQRVIEGVMQHHTVLPVKFGTLLAEEEEVRALLAQGHRTLAEALAAIQDKVEIEVAATWNIQQVLLEIGQEEEILRAREALTSGQTPPTVEQRVRLGQMVKACLERQRNRYRERMVSYLRPLALDVQPNALISEDLVMNVAFLLQKTRQPEFEERIHRLDELFQNEIAFRVIGPLPPYSFSTAEIRRLRPEQLEEAWQTLHLGETISAAEVRTAYRRLAAQTQRNLKPGDEQTKARFGKLRQASDLLLAYCRGHGDGHNGEQRYSLDHAAVARAFLIALARSGCEEIDPARYGGGGSGA